MAQHVKNDRSKVYLGYEDEFITDKHRGLVNFTTNKIGGRPDWPNDHVMINTPQCKLCGLSQLLALQIYAPLDNSKYHRTLYIFSCINPNCWNQNESWMCLRVQSLEQASNTESLSSSCATVQTGGTKWLADADDWGDTWNDNVSEQNGNNLVLNDPNKFSLSAQNTNYEEELEADFSELQMDDPNANSPTSVESPVGVGAVGRLDSPHASAEIEGEESEVVCIDTPTQPRRDLIELLREVSQPPGLQQHQQSSALSFVEMFVAVDEEFSGPTEVPQHVRELYMEYQRSAEPEEYHQLLDLATTQQQHMTELTTRSDRRGRSRQQQQQQVECTGADLETATRSGSAGTTAAEKYERALPRHGDEMFHEFVSRIQENPGQILRYARDSSASLPLYPLSGGPVRCRHCGDETTFELQILPTLIPKLKLSGRPERGFQLEFGTVLVFTCARSCWSASDAFREEQVIVQAEKL